MIQRSRVALVACASYDQDKVDEAVKQGVGLIGGIGQFVKPGEKILLKLNVLIGAGPEKCVCTHPAVLKAAAKLLKEAGALASCGDSPAFGGTSLNMRIAGLKQAAEEMEIPIADFSKGTIVSHKDAVLTKRFTVSDAVLAADGLISLPKLKAHALMRMTGAVKNQFGCLPGMLKSQQHAKTPDCYELAAMIVDINTFIKPRLYIMDAVMAMEGNGPRNGTPRKIGAILVSPDPVALDAVASKIINLDPAMVPTCTQGEKAGLGTYRSENIEIIGDKIEGFICKDFIVVRKPVEHYTSGPVRKFVKNRISPRPVIDKKKCTHCGTCVRHCPVSPKAVDWVKGDEKSPPEHHYGRCIRCFCCQELCPEGAISVKMTLLGRMFYR
jgi:uncharacterized protein (DUF362 family)/ferredoxin